MMPDDVEEVALPALLQALELPPTILAGLHACGDLTADCCRMFASTIELQGLVMCGCCYGLVTEPTNFPMYESSYGTEAISPAFA